jgi:hypothetical protein
MPDPEQLLPPGFMHARISGAYKARFNGEILTVLKADPPGGPVSPGLYSVWRSWRAVSGRPGYQRKGYQHVRDTGPIPEGRYLVRQTKLQLMTIVDDMVGTLGSPLSEAIRGRKVGAWPGGSIAWGVHRVELEPFPGTNTFGRKNFFIHGGTSYGSAGCIDLAMRMHEFVHFLRTAGDDVIVKVEYLH